ncbi:MAG: hypothetical protein SOT90_05465, partial [Muribaculaceae bacterium]|nr:hypothetical protein [Muribaculaceae bacterium]
MNHTPQDIINENLDHRRPRRSHSATTARCSRSTDPSAKVETMTRGGHFRHPGGGGSRAKPGISPTWASATCPEREHAPKIATPE